MPMLYAVLKLVHLLSLVVWVGGMFFTLTCLRPALGVLDAPARPRLMNAVLLRFFAIVNAAIGLVLASGLGMLWLAWRAAAGSATGWRMPPSWVTMVVLGATMMAIFGYLRGRPYRRLQAALQAQDGPSVAALLARIRAWVTINLALGVLVIAVMKLGATA
jgi:uncharacterized membrane protein